MNEHVVAGVRFTFSNWDLIVSGIFAVLGLAEIIVRLVPTVDPDGFVERVGKLLHKLLDKAKVPNITHQSKLEGAAEITPSDVERFEKSIDRKINESLKK